MTEKTMLALSTLREVSSGLDVITAAWREASSGGGSNVPFPLMGHEAQIHLEATKAAYLHVLQRCSAASLKTWLLGAQSAVPSEPDAVAKLQEVVKGLDAIEQAFQTARRHPQPPLPSIGPDALLIRNAQGSAYLHALEMCNSGSVQEVLSSLPVPVDQAPAGKAQRPLEPRANPPLAEAVLAKFDSISSRPMTRHSGGGYIVGIEAHSKAAIAVVDGDFGRAEFKAVHEEIEAIGLDSNAFLAIAGTATYSGPRIHFTKFEELGLDVERLRSVPAESPADEAPSAATAGLGPKAYRVEVSGGGELNVRPRVAVFEVDEELALDIVKLATLVKAIGVYKIERFDYRANFLQYDPEADPEEAQDAGEDNMVRTDCDCLVVTDDQFFFRAYVKHTDDGVECHGKSVSELAQHFGIPFGQPLDMRDISAQLEQALPDADGYERGFKDALESISLALAPKVALPILTEAVTTALDAYSNNADHEAGLQYDRPTA